MTLNMLTSVLLFKHSEEEYLTGSLTRLWLPLYVYVCMCVCVYVYIYIYIYNIMIFAYQLLILSHLLYSLVVTSLIDFVQLFLVTGVIICDFINAIF